MFLRWLFAGCFVVLFGLVHSQNAPITIAPVFYNVTPGEVTVPVTVTGFDQIGAISLNLEYDPSVLTFVQGIQNPALTGMFAIGSNLLPSGMQSLAIGWFGNAQSLDDGSAIVDLKFNFLGGTTNLTWFDDGGSCEYTDAEYYALNDIPTACHFRNGIITSEKCLNLSLLLQGFYNPESHQMISAVGSFSGDCSDGIADYTQIELHSSTDYSSVLFTANNINLGMGGFAKILLPSSMNGNYFITVRHRNSIATVSAVPVSFSGNIINYNFTDNANKAYGNNMIQMADGKWAFYAGDVNQDGSVDIGDMTPVENDAGNFATGYLLTDVNGDGTVDTADMTMIDNNATGFIGGILP